MGRPTGKYKSKKPNFNWKIKRLKRKLDKVEEKYSIPIYENGVKTDMTIDGIVGDERYQMLITYGDGKNLPNIFNVNLKK